MKHMLMIGGSREVHPKAKKMGFKLSMIFDIATAKNRKNLEMYETVIALPNVTESAAWIEAAQLINQIAKVDCIGGFNEPTQHLAAIVAEALGLPFHSAETIRLTRQKDELRIRLRDVGLDTTPSKIVTSREDILAFAELHGYPIVLKPVDGRGSLSVSILRGGNEVDAAFDRFQNTCPELKMLVEGFLSGDEYSVESFSEAGVHKIISVTQKFKDPVTCVETGHCIPAPLQIEDRELIVQFVSKVLAEIGLKDGPAHTEVILTPKGPQIVETHARIGGDCIVDLVNLSFGIDMDDLWLRQTGGETVLAKVHSEHKQFSSISFVTPNAHGILQNASIKKGFEKSNDVVSIEILQSPGAEMNGAQDSFARGAYAIAQGKTAQEATDLAKFASAQIEFTVLCQG